MKPTHTLKTCFLLSVCLVLCLMGMGQVPSGINYQGVARDASGNPLPNQNISLKLSIREDSSAGTVAYSETHSLTTNSLGLFTTQLGQGTPVTGGFSVIEWSQHLHFLEVELDENGGSNFTLLGTQQLWSVPYAMHADLALDELTDVQAVPAAPGEVLTFNGTEWVPDSTSGDDWGNQAVIHGSSLTGDGTPASPLEIQVQGDNTLVGTGTSANLLGINVISDNSLLGNGQNATPLMLNAQTDQTLAGTGVQANKLSIARQGAQNGQVLKWQGNSWVPADDLRDSVWIKNNFGIYQLEPSTGIGMETDSMTARLEVRDSSDTQKPTVSLSKMGINDSASVLNIYNSTRGEGIFVRHLGQKGSGLYLKSDEIQNDSPSLLIENLTTGSGLEIDMQETTNSRPGLAVLNQGTGPAIQGLQISQDGNAGYFMCFDSLNRDPSVTISSFGKGNLLHLENYRSSHDTAMLYIKNVGTGHSAEIFHSNLNGDAAAMNINNQGKGPALFLANTTISNDTAALFAQGNGYGQAGLFAANPGSGTKPTVQIVNLSQGAGLLIENGFPTNDTMGLQVLHHGVGIGARFHSINATNPNPVIQGIQEGTGPVATFVNLPGTMASAVGVNNQGAGSGIFLRNSGLGIGLEAMIVNPVSTEAVIKASHTGSGEAALLESSGASPTSLVLRATQYGGTGGVADFYAPTSSGTAVEISNGGSGVSAGITQPGTGEALFVEKTGGFARAANIQITNPSNPSDAVLIQSNSSSGTAYALHANNTGAGSGILISGDGDVGGDFWVSGTLIAGTKFWRIDHPHAPTEKYLNHASVESNEMLNIYSGTITLNAAGEAIISLPSWFDDINTDFRYQLTCIGGWSQVYIAEKIHGNQFRIAGGTPGLEVSWQVTAVRDDAFARTHPMQVEQPKPEFERGTYLHPEGYGLSKTSGLDHKRANLRNPK